MKVDDIKKGEGAVVDVGNKKVAVYKDEEGNVHKFNPICTHLGCLVQWNGEEGTWDCPCHGSRFTKGGKLISGPAKEPLDNA